MDTVNSTRATHTTNAYDWIMKTPSSNFLSIELLEFHHQSILLPPYTSFCFLSFPGELLSTKDPHTCYIKTLIDFNYSMVTVLFSFGFGFEVSWGPQLLSVKIISSSPLKYSGMVALPCSQFSPYLNQMPWVDVCFKYQSMYFAASRFPCDV